MVKPGRQDLTPPSVPDLLQDVPTPVLVVDLAAGTVVAANGAAVALSGGDGPAEPGVDVAGWLRQAGLDDAGGVLARVTGGEAAAGRLVARADAASGDAAGLGDWWASAVPLTTPGDGAASSALVTLVPVGDADVGAEPGGRHPAMTRLGVLADVADATADLDSPIALQKVADVLAPGLAPWCAMVVANGHLRVLATAGDVRARLRDSLPLHRAEYATADDPVGAQIRGETPTHAVLDAAGEYGDGTLTRWLLDQLEPAGSGSCIAVPVPGRRDVLGLLVVGTGAGALDPEDAALLREVARRVGLSMENARLYAREHALAETLQRSMLPEQAGVPGLDVWSYYAPNADHAQVGGDWYDILQLGPDAVALVVGDVVGHDVEAAAAMGQLRSLVRAYATGQEDPAQVLMRVDQLVRGMRIPRSASLVLATLTRDEDCWELVWSRAGHLPPLLVRGGDVTVLSAAGGTLVGVGDRPRTTETLRLVPGDVLLLYTDGLIERRARSLMDGLQLLREVGAGLLVSDAAGIGEQLLAALGEEPEDDMAVVVLRIPEEVEVVDEPAGTPRQRRWQLPGDPASIGRARRLTLKSCLVWGLDCGPQAELVVSELVANAVLHGWGPVGLRLRHSPEGLVIEVDDDNPTPPAAVEAEQRGIGGYGLHVVQRLAEWGWHRAGAGKTVWARVPERGQLAPGAAASQSADGATSGHS